MSRNRKQQSNNSQSQGGITLPGNLTLSLGPKGVSISGPEIQPQRMTFKPRQQQPQQGPKQSWSPNSGGGGSAVSSAMQSCLLAATAAAQIQQQQFTLHQQAQANSQMLISALTQVASSMGVTAPAGSQKKQKQYRAPQQHFQHQQKQAAGQNRQQRQNQPQQQRQPQYA